MAISAKKAKSDSFVVIDKGLRILITRVDGWYAVQGVDIRGLNTQGKTIEEAIYMAHDAAEALEEARAIMAEELAKRTKQVEKESVASAPKRKARRSPRMQSAGVKQP